MAKTHTLPGIEQRNLELVRLAEDYVEARDQRMKLTKPEVEFKQRLIAMMNELKLTSYHDDEANLSIVLESTTTVKVKISDGSDDE